MREALEWIVRLARPLGGRAHPGFRARRQCRRARARAWRPRRERPARRRGRRVGIGCARVGPSRPAVLAGFGVIVLAALAAPRCAYAARCLSVLGARRSAARFCRAPSRQRRADSRVDLPLSHSGLRAEHHESVLSRPRVHPGRDRRGPEDLRRRHDDAGRVRRGSGGRALWAAARDGDWRLRGAAEQSPVHLARDARPQPLSRSLPPSASTMSRAASRARA